MWLNICTSTSYIQVSFPAFKSVLSILQGIQPVLFNDLSELLYFKKVLA